MKATEWRMSTPEELLAYAKKTMLDGRDPQTDDDWQRVANYIAFNVRLGDEKEALLIMAPLIPLDAEILLKIAEYQRRNPEKNTN